MNHVIPWLLGPFFGQTPNTYFAHHMGMHHREENLTRRPHLDDALHAAIAWATGSATRAASWSFGLFELIWHLPGAERTRSCSGACVLGEGVYWSA